jgi:alkylation response protein AidB-like acyl-CoA dehydrogenase
MAHNTSEQHDTEDQHAFRLKARAWMAGRLPPRRADEPHMDWENKELIAVDRRSQRILWDGGLAGITVPVEYGGLGLSRRFEFIFAEEAEAYRLPWHFGNNPNIVLPVLLGHASEAQKQHYIPSMLCGDHIWCQMTSEPSGGSDLFGLITRAEKRGDKWVLNGSKIWTTGGADSDMGLCLARTDATVPKHAGLTMFVVEMKTSGMTTRPLTLVNGTKDFCQEFLDDVELPEDHIIGEINGGWTVATTQLAAERSAVARGWHMGVGAAVPREHIELATEPLELARVLGLTQDKRARQIVGEVLALEALRELSAQRAANGIASGTLPATVGGVASLASSTYKARVTELMSELAGACGVTGEVDGGEPGQGMDRVWMHRIGGGTSEMLRNTISERHLGLPREPSVDRDMPFNQLRQNIVPGRIHRVTKPAS